MELNRKDPMKKCLLALVFFLFLAGCSKKEEGCMPVSPKSEEAQIIEYANSKGIIAEKHASGIFYQIMTPGTGTTTPTLNSRVYITYTGQLLNGTLFDQGTDASKTGWKLGGLIEGWGIGLPLIKKGGRIKLIIPSSLAYGCNGAPSIPPNAVLYFDVTLVDLD